MVNLKDDINSLSDFKRNTGEFLKRLKKSGRPVVLTVNGRAELVIQDAQSYQSLLEISDRLETLEALKPAIAEMQAGKGEKIDSVIAELLALSSAR
jgi:prevent-host-death family protein